MNASRFRRLEADDHVERSGLASAVRAQQPDHLARFDVQSDVVDYPAPAIRFLQIRSRKRPYGRLLRQAGSRAGLRVRLSRRCDRRRCYCLRQLFFLALILFAERALETESTCCVRLEQTPLPAQTPFVQARIR